jgi:hypothetical protein
VTAVVSLVSDDDAACWTLMERLLFKDPTRLELAALDGNLPVTRQAFAVN